MVKHSAVCFSLLPNMSVFLFRHPTRPPTTLTLTSCYIVVINGDIMALLLFHVQLGQLSLNLIYMKMILSILLAL